MLSQFSRNFAIGLTENELFNSCPVYPAYESVHKLCVFIFSKKTTHCPFLSCALSFSYESLSLKSQNGELSS